jgi:hypothetical protein
MLIAGLIGATLPLTACQTPPSPQAWVAPDPAPAVVSASPTPSPTTITGVEAWSYGGDPGLVIRTSGYRLWTTETDAAMLDRLPRFLDRSLARYISTFGPLPSPEMKLDTFLMRSRDQWARLTKDLMGDQADVYLQIDRGGFAAGGRALLWSIGPRDTLAIAAHEGWHQYTQRAFREALPIWLEESIATYMEGFIADPSRDGSGEVVFSGWANPERFDRLQSAVAARQLLRLDELLAAAPQQLIRGSDDRTLTYYAQVWALAHFLREGEDGKYAPALSRLLTDAAYGRLDHTLRQRLGPTSARSSTLSKLGPGAFLAYFNDDLDAASLEYDRFIEAITGPLARQAVTTGRSPLTPIADAPASPAS